MVPEHTEGPRLNDQAINLFGNVPDRLMLLKTLSPAGGPDPLEDGMNLSGGDASLRFHNQALLAILCPSPPLLPVRVTHELPDPCSYLLGFLEC